jgi:hypothetical protein
MERNSSKYLKVMRLSVRHSLSPPQYLTERGQRRGYQYGRPSNFSAAYASLIVEFTVAPVARRPEEHARFESVNREGIKINQGTEVINIARSLIKP